jgi:hypothetical protein
VVTIRHIEDTEGKSVGDHALEFVVANHDEIIQIVQRAQSAGRFETDADAAAFATGLKLPGVADWSRFAERIVAQNEGSEAGRDGNAKSGRKIESDPIFVFEGIWRFRVNL